VYRTHWELHKDKVVEAREMERLRDEERERESGNTGEREGVACC